MFKKKLEEAARKSRLQLIILLMFVVILALGSATVFLMMQASLKPSSKPSQIQAEGQSSAPPPAQSKMTVREAVSSSEKALQSRTSEEVVQAINRYEQEFETTIKSDGFKSWDDSMQSDFTARKDKLIARLANGETDLAFEEANQLIADASAAVENFGVAFDQAMSKARAAYAADDVTDAEIQVETALELKPENAAARELLERIQKLPEILDLMEKTRIAKVENNLEEELRLSAEIARIDPKRTLYQDRVKEIETLLRERRFEATVTAGLAASRAEELEKLKRAYEQVKSLYPDREETQNLAALLKELKRKLTFRQFVKEGDVAIQQDDWETALDLYKNAAALYPENAEAQEAIILSQKILQHRREISGFLRDPKRLSTASVQKAAEQSIEAADIYGSMSPGLAKDIEQLTKEIVWQNVEIDVWVLSDKLTDVSVRGVGKVGKVERYKIQLKPGDYIFEGRREGFRTKSVRITIAPEDRQVEVKVISDERI